MKHARIPLDGEPVAATLPDLIVTVTGAMRHIIDYTPHAGRLQPTRAALPSPLPAWVRGELNVTLHMG